MAHGVNMACDKFVIYHEAGPGIDGGGGGFNLNGSVDVNGVSVVDVEGQPSRLVTVGSRRRLAGLVQYALSATLGSVVVGGPFLVFVASVLEDVGVVAECVFL